MENSMIFFLYEGFPKEVTLYELDNPHYVNNDAIIDNQGQINVFQPETEMFTWEPLCDTLTSYISPKFKKNIFGENRTILNGNSHEPWMNSFSQRVKIVKCLGGSDVTNAGWALKSFVKAKCKQIFGDVRLFFLGKCKVTKLCLNAFFFKFR